MSSQAREILPRSQVPTATADDYVRQGTHVDVSEKCVQRNPLPPAFIAGRTQSRRDAIMAHRRAWPTIRMIAAIKKGLPY